MFPSPLVFSPFAASQPDISARQTTPTEHRLPLVSTFACALLMSLMVISGDAVMAQEPADPDATTLVVMAPKGPVFIQLFVLIDGEPYRSWVTEFLSTKMDVDKNGQLSQTELSLIPERLKQQTTGLRRVLYFTYKKHGKLNKTN